MFGKPEWFREKTRGWGLQPTKWQGWLYSLAWMTALGMPFVGLIARRQVPEALVWLTVISGLMAWDVRGIRGSIRATAGRDVLYIGDDEGADQRVAAKRQVPARK